MKSSIILLIVASLLWSCCSATCDDHPWPYNNTLRVGQSIRVGEYISSSTSYLTLESTGSAVIYRGAYPSKLLKLWTTSTDGVQPLSFSLTVSGNLVLMTTSGSVAWSSNSNVTAEIAVLQDDCNLVVYNKAPLTNATWSTNTQLCVVAHIIPHSHDDVGWLLTPERYYDGCYDPTGGVQSIIGSMVRALHANKSRTFVQVESYFFHRWWVRQNASVQAMCQEVVARGQFDFINGGWSMHDEACVHQESAISNMALGAQFLRENFGLTSNLTIGWHIDPFGHASTTPRIMAQMGFDAFFFWRTDYEQRNYMMQTKTLETMWRPSPSLGTSVSMFTSIMYNDYCVGCQSSAVSGFDMCPSPFCCFTCEQDEMPDWGHYFDRVAAHSRRKTEMSRIARMLGITSEKTSFTVNELAQQYAQYILSYAGSFRTNQVLIPWGCDFQHIDAEVSFALMDDILAAINANPQWGVQASYSTPERYVAAVKNLNYKWPVNDVDYFLDSDNGHAYWSGYFSSRAEYKHFERNLMNHRSAVEFVLSSNSTPANYNKQAERISVFQQAMGVAQHHDSITGTEREHVRNRYQFLLTRGLDNASAVFHDVYQQITGSSTDGCFLANLSACDTVSLALTKQQSISVFVLNPVQWKRHEVITVPVPVQTLDVHAVSNGVRYPVVAQLQPVWELTTSEDPTSPAHTSQPFELLIQVELPPMALLEIIITPTATAVVPLAQKTTLSATSSIANGYYRVDFDASTGRMTRVSNLQNGRSQSFDQNVKYYTPMGPAGGQAAGAYIFRPNVPNATPVSYNDTYSNVEVYQGPVCTEVRQYVNDHNAIHQRVRLCIDQDYVDLTTGIGPVDPGYEGVEVMMQIQTDINSGDVFYTDSEGLEMQKRIRNFHVNYPSTVTEPVASNLYPCNVMSMINSSTGAALTVIADYSRATGSLSSGELEFLMVRRLLFDDNRGVDQALNENIRVLTTSRILLEGMTKARRQAVLHTHKPILRFGPPSNSSWTFASDALPHPIHLHSRQLVAPNVFLVRVQHIYASTEGPFNLGVQLDLLDVLPKGVRIQAVREANINGVSSLEESNAQRLQFGTCVNGNAAVEPTPIPSSIVSGSIVNLNPMDIRTYIIETA